LVRLDMQRVGKSIPDHLVDPDNSTTTVIAVLAATLASTVILTMVQRAAKADEKDRVAGDRGRIDDPVERDREPRLEVEAVQSVDDGEILAVRLTHGAVGQGQVDASSGVLTVIGDGEPVARKRACCGAS